MTGPTAPSTGRAITNDTTVRDILTAHPGAESIFDRHGLLGCGGPNGPLEPIGFFARVHQVDPDVLLTELNAYVRGEVSTASPIGPEHGRDLYPWFLGTSLLLALGAGLWLGLLALWQVTLRLATGLDWMALVEAHGHLQVVGFATLFIAGVAFHVVPRFRSRTLAHRRIAIAALPLLALGSVTHAAAQDGGSPFLMLVATVLEALGTLAVAIPLLTVLDAPVMTRGPGRRTREAWEPWLLAGLGWLLVSGGLDLAIGVRLAFTGATSTPTGLLDPWLHAVLLGFCGSFVFGVALRTLPVFMGLGAPGYAASDRARWLWVAGVTVGVFGPLAGWVFVPASPDPAVVALLVASALELPATLVAAWAIGLSRRSNLEGEPAGLPREFAWFVRAAFVWLVVGIGLNLLLATAAASGAANLPFTQVQAARHALALGFLTQLMLGMASRIVPVFRGRTLRWTPLLWLGFLSLNVGVLLRVVPEFALGYASEVSAPIAASGAFAFTGILACALVLARTYAGATEAAPRADVARRAADLRAAGADGLDPKLPVGLVIEAWPELLPVLLAEGFTPLANPVSRRLLASRISLEVGARLQGVDVAVLVARLRQAIEDRGPAVAEDVPVAVAAPAAHLGRALDPRRTLAEAVLAGVYDPEIGLDVVSLGLVRELRVDDDAAVVRMTLTTPGCPAGPSIVEEVREALEAVPGIAAVRVALEFDPPWSWSEVTPAARASLGLS